ncbi:hypothetical protein PBAL39_02557 [Pedobacter sp. BAL39]|uniref:hypothetical protein n=1 Tax=Pedobacter sp. BAL39 TaxID=391596 RepID=UPI0001559292|nr:hypothetical protein [Pedobacter sp. BAL39]EDM38460.1 hypothetical protein PBAL39_02557 [Pedobacter sp. BAL39]
MMKNDKATPQPGTPGYQVEKTEELNKPKFNSGTDRRESDELPAVEQKDAHLSSDAKSMEHDQNIPEADLGNQRDDDKEQEDEKIIRT